MFLFDLANRDGLEKDMKETIDNNIIPNRFCPTIAELVFVHLIGRLHAFDVRTTALELPKERELRYLGYEKSIEKH